MALIKQRVIDEKVKHVAAGDCAGDVVNVRQAVRFASGGTSLTFCILIPLLTACRSLSSCLPSVFLYRSGRPPFLVKKNLFFTLLGGLLLAFGAPCSHSLYK